MTKEPIFGTCNNPMLETPHIDSRVRFAKAKLLRSHDRRRRCDYSEVRRASWTPARAATTRSTRAGSATRTAFGPRPRARSIGIETPQKVFDPVAGIYGRWFAGGVCNTCCNAVDRHVDAGRGEQAAIIYDSPLAGTKRTITYHRLLTEIAGARRRAARLRRRQGRPRHPLHADGAGGGDRACSPARASAPFIRSCSAASRRANSRPASTTPSRR